MQTKLSYTQILESYSQQPHAEGFTDVYTGRALSQDAVGKGRDQNSSAAPRVPLTRTNPITRKEEARAYLKTYGCDLVGVDYGNVITMRSGTAAFYDKRQESGTINVSGTRSGCRNSMVPACGVLMLPTWTGNCTCNYSVFTSLALAPMPETFEQWSAWGGLAEDGPIRRVGINFGAPGDRMTDDGTLWLDWPAVGGPSPDVRVEVTPDTAKPFYHHSLWMEGGTGWPWVFASGIQDMRRVRIDTTAHASREPSKTFSARWTGTFRADHSELTTFHGRSDGAIRLWVDGFSVFDSRRFKSLPASGEFTGRLAVGVWPIYTLHLEYAHKVDSDTAFCELSWSSPSRPKGPIPSDNLCTPDGRQGAVAGVYFANGLASGPGLLQIDPQIKFDWGREMPPLLRPRGKPATAGPRVYTVRLVFAEPEHLQAGDRMFDVKLQGKQVLAAFDICREAGGCPSRSRARVSRRAGRRGLGNRFHPAQFPAAVGVRRGTG